jgi:hypothetical protein
MNWKRVVVILSVMLVLMLGLSSCTGIYPPPQQPATTPAPNPQTTPAATPSVTRATNPVLPVPPEVPPEVLSIWKSAPASEALPAYTSGEVTIQPNTASSKESRSGDLSYEVISAQDSTKIYLKEGQWVDILVSSIDVPIYFLEMTKVAGMVGEAEKSEAAEFGVVRVVRETIPLESMELIQDPGGLAPFYCRLLYQNRTTRADKSTIFMTAARIFTFGGAGVYYFEFFNFSQQKGCKITYRAYIVGITPGWGLDSDYYKTKYLPWTSNVYSMVNSGAISQQECDKALSQWLEQFK